MRDENRQELKVQGTRESSSSQQVCMMGRGLVDSERKPDLFNPPRHRRQYA